MSFNDYENAREWAVIQGDIEGLGWEVGESFDQFYEADPSADPWQLAHDALFEWDI